MTERIMEVIRSDPKVAERTATNQAPTPVVITKPNTGQKSTDQLVIDRLASGLLHLSGLSWSYPGLARL